MSKGVFPTLVLHHEDRDSGALIPAALLMHTCLPEA